MDVKFRLVKTAGGWDGTITIPLEPGAGPMMPNGAPAKSMTVTASAKTKPAAAQKAAGAALKVLSNPAVQAVLPPQAAMAINIAKKLPMKKIGKGLRKLF